MFGVPSLSELFDLVIPATLLSLCSLNMELPNICRWVCLPRVLVVLVLAVLEPFFTLLLFIVFITL